MTRAEKKEELIGLFAVGAIFIGDLIDECFEFAAEHPVVSNFENTGKDLTPHIVKAWLLANIIEPTDESEDEKMKDYIKNVIQAAIIPKKENKQKMIAWLEKQGKTLNPDRVIAWLVANICDYEYYVKRFKQDFGL